MLVNERSRLRTFVSSARVRADQAQHTVLSSIAEGQLNYSQPIRGSKGTKKKKKTQGRRTKEGMSSRQCPPSAWRQRVT